MSTNTLTRMVAATAAAAAVLAAWPAQAAAPMARFQAPGFYRTTLGDFEITVLNDGTLDLPVVRRLFR